MCIPEARGSIFERKLYQALRDKAHLVFETYFGTSPTKIGTKFRVHPFTNGISVAFQVTTERKQAVEALKASERKYRSYTIASWMLRKCFDGRQDHRIQ